MSQSSLSRPTTTARHQRIGPRRPQYAREMLLAFPAPSYCPRNSGRRSAVIWESPVVVVIQNARRSTEQENRGRSQLRLRRAPWTISAFRADALMASPSWKSMARTVLLSKRVLKSPFGSFSWAPFGNVSLTAFLRASPMQTMPSWDQTGTPSGREGFFHFTSSITPGSAPLIRARSWPSLSPLQPVVFRTMASICSDADASFMPMLCRGGSAPSGPKGSAPCPFDAGSQANNTAAASLQQFGSHSLDVLAPRFCFLRPEHPADPLIAGKRGEVFPGRQRVWGGNQGASQVHRDGMDHAAGDRPGTHRSPIVAPIRTKAAINRRTRP